VGDFHPSAFSIVYRSFPTAHLWISNKISAGKQQEGIFNNNKVEKELMKSKSTKKSILSTKTVKTLLKEAGGDSCELEIENQ